MKYRFDIRRFAYLMLPPILRQPVLWAVVCACVDGLSNVHSSFRAYAEMISDRLSYNAFVIYLEKMLNDLFSVEGMIYIEDYRIESTLYLALREEGRDPDYLAFKDEGGKNVYVSRDDRLIGGFYVWIPITLDTPENRYTISKWVNYYKYTGTQFSIKTYSI